MNRTFLGLVAASTVVLAISACKEETPVEQPTVEATSQPDVSGKENTRKPEENEQLR